MPQLMLANDPRLVEVNAHSISKQKRIAALMAESIAIASALELSVGSSFAKIFGTNVDIGIEIHDALKFASPQRKVTRRIAAVHFKGHPTDLAAHCGWGKDWKAGSPRTYACPRPASGRRAAG